MIPRKGLPATKRTPRSICKICWQSLYSDEDVQWVITPNPGLAHATCKPVKKRQQRR